MSQRSLALDSLKGICIIAVVLYHAGYLPWGYWGVDVFFAIAGYLTTLSFQKHHFGRNGLFGDYKENISKKMKRLFPMLFVCSAVCMIFGMLVMLPDELENLGESVVATNFCANNILQAITTRNYWDVVNEYKPMLHTWYLGVLFQFYLVYPILYFLCFRGDDRKTGRAILWALTIISFSAFGYLMYIKNDWALRGITFYNLPFRFWEFGVGALLALDGVVCRWWVDLLDGIGKIRIISIAGLASYSIYMWHQPILAFTRYIVTDQITWGVLSCYLIVTAAFSILSYQYFECGTGHPCLRGKFTCVCAWIVGISLGMWMYFRAGVWHDVPELEISTNNVQRGLHSQYNHKIRKTHNKPFVTNDRIKVLCVGDSFARDWINVLNESIVSNRIEISYAEPSQGLPKDYDERAKQANYIFVTFGRGIGTLPDYVLPYAANCKIYGVGCKNFGGSCGVAYNRRWKKNWKEQTVRIADGIMERNEIQKKKLGDKFIDLFAAVQKSYGVMPIFTEEGLFISQDCRHLTHAGAKYFAKKIDWSFIR